MRIAEQNVLVDHVLPRHHDLLRQLRQTPDLHPPEQRAGGVEDRFIRRHDRIEELEQIHVLEDVIILRHGAEDRRF